MEKYVTYFCALLSDTTAMHNNYNSSILTHLMFFSFRFIISVRRLLRKTI